MKKLLVSILALLYLGTSSGAMLHLHYCMGKLAETNFVHQGRKTCSKCGMKLSQKKGGCCKDETKLVKSTTDQKISIAHFQFNQPVCLLAQVPSFMDPIQDVSIQVLVTHAPNAPPDLHAPPVYLRVGCFLI